MTGSCDQNVSLLAQDVLSPLAAPAALLCFSNFKMPVLAFQIELFLPQSGTQNLRLTLFLHPLNASFGYCLRCQQQKKSYEEFKQRGFISAIIHARAYTAEDVWTLITREVVTSQTQLPLLLPTPPQPSA